MIFPRKQICPVCREQASLSHLLKMFAQFDPSTDQKEELQLKSKVQELENKYFALKREAGKLKFENEKMRSLKAESKKKLANCKNVSENIHTTYVELVRQVEDFQEIAKCDKMNNDMSDNTIEK